MKIFLSIVLLLSLSTNVFGAVYNTPSVNSKYPAYEIKHYGWLTRNKDSKLYVNVSKDTKQFFTEEEVSRYLKLKMRNFLGKLKVNNKFKNGDYSYMTLKVEIYKYNDKIDIYYGLISFQLTPSAYVQTGSPKIYNITIPIAGSDIQIKDEVKSNIDYIVEKFAEDYYYIEDLKKAKK